MSARRRHPNGERAKRETRKPAPASTPGLRRLRAVAWTALALVAVAAVAYVVRSRTRTSNDGTPAKATGERLNLLLVTLDTTRADHLGCYGWAHAKTRYLDRLAAEGVRFDQAFTSAPITLPAHASLFTALYPTVHGVRNNGNFYLPERFPTLTTALAQQGYRTGAFVSSFILDRRYGLARGFETYDDRMEGATPQVLSLEAERRGDRTALVLSKWLEQQAAATPRAPFFAWLHLYDPHEPYRPPPPFRQLFEGAPYDGEIAFDDAILASLLDKLAQLGQLDHTLIAVTADHGESLGEHGEETHSMFLYEGALRVPLILWRPGRLHAGQVITQPVRLVDLAPTLLDLMGAPPLPRTDGRSLVPLVEGRDAGPPPALYAETYLPKFYMNWAPLRALRDARFKFIDAPRPELFDLKDDPREERNLHGTDAQRAAALRSALERVAGGEGAMHVGALDPATVEKLAALGYVGAAGGSEGSQEEATRKDPKDMIEVFNRLRRANSAVRERRFDEALPVLREVLAEDPRNAFARLVTGSAYMGMSRWADAITWYRRYLELVPSSSYAHHWLAICHLRAGEREAALREAAAALAIDPHFSDARVLRGGILAARGEYDAAVAELRQAVQTDPAKPMLRLDLAKVLAEAGHAPEARAEYETILRAQPDDVAALTGLAALLAGQGALDEAATRLTHALEVDARQAEARFNLAEVRRLQGRMSEAANEYRRLRDDAETPPDIRERARRALAALPR